MTELWRAREGSHDGSERTSAAAITLAWLVRLRWGAVLGQVSTVAIATVALGVKLPLAPILALIATTAASNVGLALRLRSHAQVSSRSAGIVLAVDTLILTALLYFSGGPSNPFSVLYLVHVTLAALVLGIEWAVGMVAVSAVCYAGLFFWHRPVAGLDHAHHSDAAAFSAHLQGMWVAFTVAASLIAYFVARVAAALRERESDLAKAQAAAARAEKLASLTSLAAGAAHELGTPLGTIAVVSKELERSIRERPGEAIDDARLIRTEVERCRVIVQRMTARAGDAMGEIPEQTTALEVFERALARLSESERGRVRIGTSAPAAFVCPVEGLLQVVLSLVHNALYASRGVDAPVVLASTSTDDLVRLVVSDEGEGVAADAAARIGEPFFTTKPPGEGMGLGLFLATAFAQRCGGGLAVASSPGQGTQVTLELPRLEAPGG